MASSQAACLLCLSMNKNTINLYSDEGKELNIISILLTHFWFSLDEINDLSQNICYECLNKTESFHEFYQSVRIAHKKFETVFVKLENDLDIQDGGETDQPVQEPLDNMKTEFFEIENIQDVEDDESSNASSVCEIPYTNSIDTETRGFDSLPEKTRNHYLDVYQKFLVWKSGENIDKDCFSEAVMLEYFYYLNINRKPSSLYAYFAMLRTTVQRNHNIDISYPEVTSFLKKSTAGFRPPKYVFQPDELQRFFSEANDFEYLAVKVIMIFFIYGEIRTEDFIKICVNDVSEHGSVFVIKIPNTKTNGFRSFTVENQYAACVRQYIELRPTNIAEDRFFLIYRNGKCIARASGENMFRNAPKSIASFLNLKDAESYTRYSFRNKKKIVGLSSGQKNLETSTVTSAITSSKNTSNVATASTSSTNANNICEEVEGTPWDLLPGKSREKYVRSYDIFMTWKTDKKIDEDCFSKAVMLEYFHYMKSKYKPTSLWAEYSKLRTTIQKNHDVDIGYQEVKALLKTSSFAYIPQKSNVFQPDEILRFLSEAADNEFLAVKVIMIFGIFGVLHIDTFLNINVNDVIQQGSVFVIKIPDAKKDGFRSFTVESEYAVYVQKYKELRPANVTHDRFFIYYKQGKCTEQPIGRAKLLTTSKVVANFLNLKDAENYSLMSFRKKSLKRGSMLSSVSDTYSEECVPNKKKDVDLNSKEIKLKGSNEAMVKSTITNSVNTSSIAITSISRTTAKKICTNVKATAWELLPEKSREKYVRSYENFITWQTDENIDKDCFSKDIMLKYFNHIKHMYKPTSLWAEYSKLKATIQKNDLVDISYPEITSLLRSNSSGYHPQKCNIFQADQMRRFLSEADDRYYLAAKVIMIFGIYGVSKKDELKKVDVNNVVEHGSAFVIKIPDTKTNGFRKLTVENEYASYVQKYKELRPENVTHDRFFLNYQKGKCTAQPIGNNKFTHTPKVIANFLSLEDAENYTLYSFSKKILKR